MSVLGVLPPLPAISIPAAAAAPEDGSVTLSVEAGVDGYAEPFDVLTVTVDVDSDTLVDGEVVARFEGDATETAVPVQVPAGTAKRLVLLLPSDGRGDLHVQVVRNGDVLAEADVAVRYDDESELVGVLPNLVARLEELPEQATLDDGTGIARLAPVAPEILDAGVGALDVYDTIVGAGDDLDELAVEQRRPLLLWIGAGGRLLLDDGTTFDALPAAWRPVPGRSYAWAGRGEVRLLDGAAADGRWSAFIESSPQRDELGDPFDDVFVDRQSGLAARAGFELADVMPLAVTVAVYGFVVGPLLYLVLRRARRLTLGWVVVPVLAAVTAGAVVAVGGRYRHDGHATTSTFVESGPAGAIAVSNVLVLGDSGGERSFDLPAGWSIDPAQDQFLPFEDVPVSYRPGGAGGAGTFEQRLDAGQVAVSTFVGAVDTAGFELTAELDGDELVGTVTNSTTVPLDDVAVFAGTGAAEVGRLEPGQSAAWSVPAPDTVGGSASRGDEVWQPPWMDDGTPQVAELGVYGTAAARAEMYPTGLARAVGWSDELAAPLAPPGSADDVVGLSVLTPVAAAGHVPVPATIRAAATRGPQRPDGFDEDLVMRYVLAPDAAPADLVLEAGEGTRLWDGENWVPPGDGADAPAVPAAAVRGGVVLVRVPAEQVQVQGPPALVLRAEETT